MQIGKEKKKKTSGLGSLLFEDRFVNGNKVKKCIQRNSIIEYTGIGKLSEKIELENKVIFNAKEDWPVLDTIDQKYSQIIDSLDFNLSIPPRVPHADVSKNDYKELESFCFNKWKRINDSKIFERNMEIWRQFWLSCERAETIVQIVDSRNPEAFINNDIIKMYPTKKHLIFCNKADLLPEDVRQSILSKICSNVDYFLYSTKEEKFEYKLSGVIAMIGYPNVGKSSTINLILKQKKVRVSSTPGKTRYLQSIETENFTLLDCPGLIFPKYSKIELALMAVLNIDQVTDLIRYERQIIEYVGAEKIRKFYKLKNAGVDILDVMSNEKGWIRSKCLKAVAKDYSLGEIPYF